MKRFAKLFIVALVVTLVASLFIIAPSAASFVDPNELKPSSDRVVFIMDPDENGELPGDGSGDDAENPLAVVDHESFDPAQENPRFYYQTAFYQATEMLAKTGGTVVICGPVYLGIEQAYGHGDTTRDVYTANFGENVIKFTSVYNGVDYREKNGAKITLEAPAEIGVYGQSVWENLDIETIGLNRVISFHNNPTLVGEGVNCYPQDDAFEGVAENYVSLSGGHRYSGGVDLVGNMVVKSGTYNIISTGIWGVNNQRKENEDGTLSWTNNMEGESICKLVLDGTTTILGQLIGTTRQGSDFSGNTTITINGGKYECDIYVVGTTGMLNENGQAILKVNGGDFSSCWSINDTTSGHRNNAPAFSLLDFSGWKGDIKGIAEAISVTTTFTSIKYPDGVTEEDVIAEAPAETTATPVVEETDVPKETKAPDKADESDMADNDGDDSVVGVGNNDGGSNIGLIVGIIVGAVLLVAIIVAVTAVVVAKVVKKSITDKK